MRTPLVLKWLLVALSIIELLLFTYWQNIAGVILSPLLILIVSCSIGVLALMLSSSNRCFPTMAPKRKIMLVRAIGVASFICLSVIMFALLHSAFQQVPLNDTTYSDVILTHRRMARKFIDGTPAYEAFKNAGYAITPAYMPLQWLPFTIAEYFHFDYRWLAVFSFWLASAYFFIINLASNNNSGNLWDMLSPIWPLAAFLVLFRNEPLAFQITLEALVAGYYLLLATAIRKNNWVLMAVALSVCVLSRMSIVMWVPLCIAAYFISDERKKAFSIMGIGALFVLVFYCPFLMNNPSLLSNPYASYANPITGLWQRGELMNGLSFNTWGMKFLPGSMVDKVAMYQKIHFGVCALTIFGLIVFYYKTRNKYSLNAYLLFSLKIYLTVFYLLIQLPFIYLFIVPLMVTPVLLSFVFMYTPVGCDSAIAQKKNGAAISFLNV